MKTFRVLKNHNIEDRVPIDGWIDVKAESMEDAALNVVSIYDLDDSGKCSIYVQSGEEMNDDGTPTFLEEFIVKKQD